MSGKEIQPAAATPMVPFKIGSQDLRVPADAGKFLVQRTGQSWEVAEVATLGESDIFVRRDITGQVKLTHKVVTLSVSKKELVRIGANYMPTVLGFNKLNQVAGINQITPPSLLVDGSERSNPHPEYSPNGEIVRMVARKIAIGFSPTGNLVAMDVVKIFNFGAYYIQDLIKKQGHEYCKFGTMVQCELDPTAEVSEMKGNIYARKGTKIYTFKVIKDLEGIWIDVTHEEIKKMYDNHTQRQKFAAEQAQSMAWRNALKAHPAFSMSSMKVEGSGDAAVAQVGVFSYKNVLSHVQMQEIGSRIVAGQPATIAGASVEVVSETSEATVEEYTATAAATPEEADDAPASGMSVEPEVDAEAVRARIMSRAKEKSVNVEQMARQVYGSRFANLTTAQLALFDKQLEKITKSEGEK